MMNDPWPIERSQGVADGRSSGSACGPLAWAVATSDDKTPDFDRQIARCFEKIDRVLADLKTDRRYLLSVGVYLADLDDKAAFDKAWLKWVGADPRHWPQRSCVGATLSRGTLVEITVMAARPQTE
jgi:enamine deaminase RidA (YjgF/YER057c/UK114 family)